MTTPCTKEEEFKTIEICIAVLKSRWKTFGVILLALISLSGGWTTLVYRSSIHAKELQAKTVEKVEEKTNKNAKEVNDVKVEMGKMQNDLEYVKKSIDKQDVKLDKILEEVKKKED